MVEEWKVVQCSPWQMSSRSIIYGHQTPDHCLWHGGLRLVVRPVATAADVSAPLHDSSDRAVMSLLQFSTPFQCHPVKPWIYILRYRLTYERRTTLWFDNIYSLFYSGWRFSIPLTWECRFSRHHSFPRHSCHWTIRSIIPAFSGQQDIPQSGM